MTATSTLDIDGITYDVVGTSTFTVGPKENSSMTRTVERISYTLKRPRGRRLYHAVQYENGTFSSAV
jgi:hypothetical protein